MIQVQVYQGFGANRFFHDFECGEPFRHSSVWEGWKVELCCFPGIVYDVGTLGKQPLPAIWGAPITKVCNGLLRETCNLPCLKCQGTRTTYDG